MRLLIDAQDLIGLILRHDPASPAEFDAWMRRRGGYLVLSGTNVVEASVFLLESGRSGELGNLVRAIANIPHCFLKELGVFVEELGGALVAFGRGKEPLAVDPYVAKWSDTLGVSLGKSYASGGILEAVTHLWRTAPETLRHFHRYQEIIAEDATAESSVVENDAALPDAAKQHFTGHIERQLRLHGFILPSGGAVRFADWVHSDPLRCPGLRLAYEVNRAILSRPEKSPAEDSLRGLGHVNAIPYVDGVTVGGTLFEVCRSVSRSLRDLQPAVSYHSRIFPNLRSVMDEWP